MRELDACGSMLPIATFELNFLFGTLVVLSHSCLHINIVSDNNATQDDKTVKKSNIAKTSLDEDANKLSIIFKRTLSNREN